MSEFRVYCKSMGKMGDIAFINYMSGTVTAEIEGRGYLLQEPDYIRMQSTGLVDKNGQEIFEGDIVEFEDADDIENVYINQGVIEWCQGGFTVSNRTTVTLDDLLDEDTLEVTIVGNIYENPELLEDFE